MFSNDHNEKSNIWSSGTILFYILFGYSPFYDTDEKVIKENILNANINKDTISYKRGNN